MYSRVERVGISIYQSMFKWQDLAIWNRAISKEQTYRTRLAPEARKTLDAALLAYETDRTDFFSIYRAQLDIIQFERVVRMAQVEAAQMKVAVEMLVGVSIENAEEKSEEDHETE